MKNKTLLFLLLCAIPAFSPWVGASSDKVGTLNAGIAFLLPKADADFSDLDVRDAQNRSINSPSASQELEALFRENLLDLTVFANTHSFTKALSWIESLSYLFNKSILLKLSTAFELFQDAFLPPSRRFVHNVHNLCISFSVGLFAACLLLYATSLQRTPRKVHLRC